MPVEELVRESHKRHRDDTWVDRVEVTTVPRWKTSGLSGDEWRFSYTVTLYRKGIVVAEKGFGSISYALVWASLQAAGGFCPAEQDWPDGAPGYPYGDGVMCDNPACPEPATWKGTLREHYSRSGDGPLPKHGSVYYRVFCNAHKRRGDCALEDADDNYAWTPLAPAEGTS